MKTAYIDYSMSVIVSRALPDVRDGLKPVHRRVLFGMSELGMSYNKSHKKSARIVGEVLGKYHPHGDTSVYDTMVRMAQDWSLRYPLVDGQGNFGSMDGDSPAAMRYTEARLSRIADEILSDLDKDTVDFKLNFDDTLEEPTVMPSRLPNLLINGASGIAVGMATNMMPHNLTEVIEGVTAMVDNPDMTVTDLMEFIKAPDFPTGGIIYGMEGIREGFATGRGRVVLRGRAEIVTHGGRDTIIITEIPYQVNKANLVIKIAELVNEKRIEGVTGDGLRDESDRNGVRIVIELRRDANAQVVLNQLYKLSPLQTSYGINNVCLVRGRPMTLNIKQIIEEFIKFRLEVIVRRTKFELRKAKERAHLLEGFLVALDEMDRIITLIRGSKTVDDAHKALTGTTFNLSADTATLIGDLTDQGVLKGVYNLSDLQAKAILEMRLQRLTGLERDKVRNEYEEIKKTILYLQSILDSEELQRSIIKTELQEIKDKFGDKRRTDISFADGEINIEDIIPNDDMLITISHLGYIKRTNLAEYRSQSRGGRGSRGANTRTEDFVEHMFVAGAHNYILLFTSTGRCFWMRAYEIPEATKTSMGRALQNILSISGEEKIRAYIRLDKLTDPEFLNNNYIIFCTRDGVIKKTPVEQFSRPRTNGIAAITIREGDELLEAKLTNGSNEIVIATRYGRAIRFPEAKVRPMGRTAAGVSAVTLNENVADDCVVGMVCVNPADPEETIFVVSAKGNGKRTDLEDYRVTNRGGKGVTTIKITEKTGLLVALKIVRDGNDLVITTRNGITIRMAVADLRVMGRATQGVRVIRIDDADQIADVAIVEHEEVTETEEISTEVGENVEDVTEANADTSETTEA